jgi:hypothetical protein
VGFWEKISIEVLDFWLILNCALNWDAAAGLLDLGQKIAYWIFGEKL